jgi:hypothetical protein
LLVMVIERMKLPKPAAMATPGTFSTTLPVTATSAST